MRICYVGPTSRQAALQEFVSPGVELVARRASGGPPSIESMYDEYLSVPGIMEAA